MNQKYLVFLFLFLFFVSIPLFSQPQIQAVFTQSPPGIDGFVNESMWNDAAVIDELFQREPRPGEPVSEKTEFLFLYDRNNIYIAVRCHDDPEKITAKELARDVSLGEDDRVQVIFDTFLDGRTGYWFQIGPRGSIGDALIGENGKDFNKSWDGLWDGKARITAEGWEAEMIIPFKTMGFKKGQDTWGLKLIRHIKRKSESSYWPVTSLNMDRFGVSDAGRITGLRDITQGIGLDIVTYVTAGSSKDENVNAKPLFDAGADAFYQITPSLKAALTINTDFAQTEVDEKQINLTRFSLFFPEKRDFFLDGAGYFRFGINGDQANPQSNAMIPFFSRRIGLNEDGNPVAIKYGGKFTGKIGKWNMGFLHIRDDNEWDNPGYTVARISRNIGKQSSAGIIGTNGNALSDAVNYLAGIDLKLATSELWDNKLAVLCLYGLKSFTNNLEGNDFSFGAELSYPNDFLNFRAGYMQIGENFTPGLGFLPRRNISSLYSNITLGPRPDESIILQVKTGIGESFITNLRTGEPETFTLDIKAIELMFLSGDAISLSSQYQFESLNNDFVIFGTHTIVQDDYRFWRHSLQLSSAKRRNLWFSSRISIGSFYSGKRTDLLLQGGYKIGVPVFAGAEADQKFVDLPDGKFQARIYRINLNILINPRITWYNFAQYENLNERIGWQSRFQWIFKPGKEIFITYNSPFIDPLERFRPEIYEARVKVKYTIRF